MTTPPVRSSERGQGLLVSVVVPVHEDREVLLRCLDALRAQDLDGSLFEVLVCDNGSLRDPVTPDGVVGAHAPTVTLITTAESGSYLARNRCLERASAPVLAFTDADCTPHRAWLREGLAAIERTGADLVAGRVATYTRRVPPTAVELYEQETAFPQERYVEQMGFGVTANLFVRRCVFDDVGPFDQRLRSGGDRELCERAGAAGHRISYGPDAVVDHPARATVAEISAKADRVLRGALEDGRLGPVRTMVVGLRPPLGALRRAAASPTLSGARQRALYVVGEVTAHYVRWMAEVRIRWLSPSERATSTRARR